MEINSATILPLKEYLSTKVISEELECLSLDSLEGTSHNKGRKAKRKYSNLSLNTTKEKTEENKLQVYNLKDYYEIVETLGMGTYSYVRHAVEKKTNRHVAIKTSRGNTSCNLLKKEYNLLKRLADDNIIKVYDFTEDVSKNEAYLIMEYFEGLNLDEYIEKNGVLSEKDSAIVLYQVLSSVQYLHELGIAHRDIKPENILINEDKEIKIIDFNISKARNSQVVSWGESKFTSVFHTQISSPLY